MQQQKTVIITGGNSGLGLACAKAILAGAPGLHVVIASRDAKRASAAVEELKNGVLHRGAGVEAIMLDLASLSSVRAFTSEVDRRLAARELPPLHGLVCNAGFQGSRSPTADGFERSFGVNHLGHYLLTNLLLPLLSPTARIAIVASGVHDPAQLKVLPSALAASMPVPSWNEPAKLAVGELGPEGKEDDEAADRGRRYSTSKLANVYFTYELARRLPVGMTVNAFDPGMMPGTGLAREYPGPMRFVWRTVLPRILPLLRRLVTPNIHTTVESGAALARLISDPALENTNGRYFEGLKEIRSSIDSYDTKRAHELWQASAVLTGLLPVYRTRG
jgi:NAD(P)-dependent dehydrogenase (short-subunit alcohol dehydrogenase family)